MHVVVGQVVRPHGLRGEVVVDARTDQPHRRFDAGADLRRPDGSVLTVVAARPHAERWLVRFAGVHDRDAADALRGTILTAEADEVTADEGEEFPDVVLVGLDVRDVDDRRVGVVRAVEHSSWQDLLVVDTDSGSQVRVPFVAAIVPAVDLGAGVVVIDPPPGLLTEI